MESKTDIGVKRQINKQTRSVFSRFALIFLLLSINSKLVSQHQQLQFNVIDTEQGLSSSEITHIMQDASGFIWIGTTDGLNRYDGYEIKNYRSSANKTNSLCDNHITTLYVDSRNQLWIGTKNGGLSLYNAKLDNFTNYSFNVYDSSSLSFNHVTSILEDFSGDLWISTLYGLNKYKPEEKVFERYFMSTKVTINSSSYDSLVNKDFSPVFLKNIKQEIGKTFNSLEDYYRFVKKINLPNTDDTYQNSLPYMALENTGKSIRTLFQDHKGNFWIGFELLGLASFDHNSGRLIDHYQNNINKNSLSSDQVTTLLEKNGQLWVGTKTGGLNIFNPESKEFSMLHIPWANNFIKHIFLDSKQTLWLGNDHGLGRYNEKTKSFTQYKPEAGIKYSLTNSAITSIYEDAQDNLWVGTDKGGVNIYTSNHLFSLQDHIPDQPLSLTKNNVSTILEDRQGRFWVGYYTAGIDLWSKQGKKHIASSGKKNQLGLGTVFTIFQSSDQNIWIGTYEGGLQRYDINTGTFLTLKHDPLDPNSPGGNDIRDIAEDKNGNLWLAIHGAGVNKYDPGTNTFTSYRANCADWTHALSNDWVNTVEVDSKNNVWIGSVSGVSIFSPSQNKFKSFGTSNSNLSHNNVTCFHEDQNQNIWVGTEIGLNLFDAKKQDFIVFNESNGLANGNIKSIEEDQEGNLWVSTNKSITKLKDKKVIRNYDQKDGLQSNEYFARASFSGTDKTIYFGGKDGISSFNPSRIKPNTYLPPVHITGVKIYDETINVENPDKQRNENIEQSQAIELEHDQNSFTVSFVGINYISPQKNLYSYKLEGIDNQWTPASTKRTATYTNVKPGNYQFKVIAANNDGHWNENGASIEVTIHPPFWLSTWAYAFYFLLILAAAYLIRRSILNQIKIKNRMEVEKMKLRFFTNISHEFRTPLTLIIDPLNKLLSDPDSVDEEKKKTLYEMMHRNSNRMLRLINQIMDTNEIDAGHAKVKVQKGDITTFTQSVFDAFKYNAEKKEINFNLNKSKSEKSEAYFDADIVEKILYNLISNAFKFTRKKGQINVSLDYPNHEAFAVVPDTFIKSNKVNPTYVRIQVEDNGKGIPKSSIHKIFERFYQVKDRHSHEIGTGIGLSLTKQLIHAHRGHITVKSTPGRGSIFSVYLPINKEAFSIDLVSEDEIEIINPIIYSQNHIDDSSKTAIGAESKSMTLLIVEDNDEIRDYIKLNFERNFNILEAENGEIGLSVAAQEIPDLIISDVMMPVMDGMDMCRQIKTNEKTSHIPIILLTAKNDESYWIKGYENGADDYISKPFSLNILSARIDNIIKTRRALQSKFSTGMFLIPKESVTNKTDKAFMQKAIEIIELNLDSPEFNPDKLIKELGMSRSVLYKKINAMTGMSVSLFIRSIRLKKAALLLAEEDLPINQIAYQVGFTDPAYFTNCFKKQFNISPREFLNHGAKSSLLAEQAN